MKSKPMRIHPDIDDAIKNVAESLEIPTSQASVIVFFGLHKKSLWDSSMAEIKVKHIRKELKNKIAMTL